MMKVEGKSTENLKEHPVLFKITNIKSLLDGLRAVDDKLE
jgi:hypothetical protein